MPTEVGKPTEVGQLTEVGQRTENGMPIKAATGLPADAETRVAVAVRDLAADASVEVVPRQVADVRIADHFPPGTDVYVPFPPNANWSDTVAACRSLVAAGMNPVAHLTARSISTAAELRSRLARLAEVKVDRLLLVAGDGSQPAGSYSDTMDVLESGFLAEYGFDRLGIAAHPEGHPQAKPADLERALARKMEYAAASGASMWIVTQFVFAPEPVIVWLERMRAVNCPLPIRVGLAGPVRLSTLLKFAARCGVRASARMVNRRRGVVRLVGNYAPDAVTEALACHRAEAHASPLCGIHLFTFGGVAGTSRWLRAKAGAGGRSAERGSNVNLRLLGDGHGR